MKDCLFGKECQEKNKLLVSAIIEIAFEYGRNFEQIYLDLDLYNIIDVNDFIFVVSKGAMIKTDNLDVEKVAKAKFQDVERSKKYQRLIEIKKELNSLVERYF